MTRVGSYRVLCGVLGTVLVLLGVAFVLGFFSAMLPGGALPGPLAVGQNGAYFVAFAGCALVGWGGGLLGAAKRPESGRTVGTFTALALVLSAVYRLLGWVMGDYAFLGNVLRVEAGVFLVLALAFVWLRPPKVAPAIRGV